LQRDLARLLGELGSPSLVPKTAQTLLSRAAQEDRLMALFVLRNAKTDWTADTRRAYFTALAEGTKFVSGEGMPRFLTQLREESLRTLSEAERKELADVLDTPSQPEDEPLPPQRPLVKKWTPAELAPLAARSTQQTNAERGEAIFRDALCIRCHRVGARGPAVGPDLTHVSGRFSRSDILQSILEPSKVVAENYRNVQVRTTDGRVLVGRVLAEGDYRSETLRLSTEPLRPSVVVELSKRDIDEYRQTDTSPMPHGLLNTFTAEEILDLLAFLESGTLAERNSQ
jgi:putative heme-binding domain-containing protein